MEGRATGHACMHVQLCVEMKKQISEGAVGRGAGLAK
jgi:hypothetical protein